MQGFWFYGRWYPLIAGGSGEEEGAEGKGGEGAEGAEGKGGAEGEAGKGKEGAEGKEGGKENEPTFSQDQLDAVVVKRVKKAEAKWKKDQEEAAAKAKMSESEKLKADKKAAQDQAAATQKAADQRIVKSEAKIVAASGGVKPERVNAFVRLMDLSDVDVDDDGEPDETALKAEVAKLLKEFPEFKGSSSAGSSSGDFGGDGSQHIFTRAEIKKKTASDPEWFTTNEKEIDRQVQAGLVK